MLINNPWGESNEKGLRAAIKDAKIELAGIEKLESRDVDVVPQLMRLKKAGADTIILVANVRPSATVVKSLARMKWDAPVVSHWGVSGGRFPELAGPGSQKVHFVQTYSFFGDQNQIGQRFIAAAKKKYDQGDAYWKNGYHAIFTEAKKQRYYRVLKFTKDINSKDGSSYTINQMMKA